METSRQVVEKNLSEIAFATVSEKVPELMDYYIGFDLVEKNDAGTRAAGLMGFKVGKQLIYIPVLFLNGKVKGTEVLYLKNSDIFVHNSTQMVNYVIGQSQQDMGSGRPDKALGSGDASEIAKTLGLFSEPPASVGQKTASFEDGYEDFDSVFDPARATDQKEMSLVEYVKKAGREEYQKIASILTEDGVWDNVVRFYDPKDLKIQFEQVKVASITTQPVKDKSVCIIKTDDALSDLSKTASLNDEEKEALMERGYIIKNAAEGKVKVFVEDNTNSKFNVVDESGVYKMVTASGKLKEVAVFIGTEGDNNERKLIVDPSNGDLLKYRGDVFYSSGNKLDAMDNSAKKDLLSAGSKLKDAKIGSMYIIFTETLKSFGPITIKNKYTSNGTTKIVIDNGYKSWPSIYADSSVYGVKIPARGGRYELSSPNNEDVPTTIIQTNHPTGALKVADGVIYVPSSAMCLEVNDPEVVSSDSETSYKKRDEERARIKAELAPGPFGVVLDALTRTGSDKLTLEKMDRDTKVSYQGKTASFSNRGDAVFHLCSKFGFSDKMAEHVVGKMYDGQRTLNVAFSKKAYPDVQDPNTQAGATRTGMPQEQQASQEQVMTQPGPGQIPGTDPSLGNWDKADPQDIALLERASNMEAREVFDPAMIGILVRTTRSQSIVQEYIPEFVDNLDRMIRLLLMFYWHNKEFSESYGSDQMAEFEDLLLSTIKNTSKTILFLKQKAVESSSGKTDIF